jgi:phosphoribosyl 1,2-cyclic phosphodiesterase
VDLLMPHGNGFQVCRAICDDPALRHTRIIVTSGRDFASDRQAALEAGAQEYLTKPVNLTALVQLLARRVGDEELKAQQAAVSTASLAAPTRLRFWGVRGSIPTPGPATVLYGGNTACVEVRAQGEILILDAGTGLRGLGHQLMAEFDDQPLQLTLLLTHTHWDHIQGLPFFPPLYKPQHQLRILGYEGARDGLAGVLSSQMESTYFPIGLRELPGNIVIEELKDLQFSVGQVRVQAFFANHPGMCVGYRLFSANGSIAYFPDNELNFPHRVMPGTRSDHSDAKLEFARDQDEKLTEFLRQTDVLIMDAQYDLEEYKDHTGWGHGCVDDVVALGLSAQVKQLYLFHHDPDHDDDRISRMVEHARQIVAARNGHMAVDAAREGVTVELPAPLLGGAIQK